MAKWLTTIVKANVSFSNFLIVAVGFAEFDDSPPLSTDVQYLSTVTIVTDDRTSAQYGRRGISMKISAPNYLIVVGQSTCELAGHFCSPHCKFHLHVKLCNYLY